MWYRLKALGSFGLVLIEVTGDSTSRVDKGVLQKWYQSQKYPKPELAFRLFKTDLKSLASGSWVRLLVFLYRIMEILY